jgi:hypothetical protein
VQRVRDEQRHEQHAKVIARGRNGRRRAGCRPALLLDEPERQHREEAEHRERKDRVQVDGAGQKGREQEPGAGGGHGHIGQEGARQQDAGGEREQPRHRKRNGVQRQPGRREQPDEPWVGREPAGRAAPGVAPIGAALERVAVAGQREVVLGVPALPRRRGKRVVPGGGGYAHQHRGHGDPAPDRDRHARIEPGRADHRKAVS